MAAEVARQQQREGRKFAEFRENSVFRQPFDTLFGESDLSSTNQKFWVKLGSNKNQTNVIACDLEFIPRRYTAAKVGRRMGSSTYGQLRWPILTNSEGRL